jgi:DEAD/DEAH box helicase domain-containing protein
MNYTEALTHLVETRKVLPVSIDQHYRTSNSCSRRNSCNSNNSNRGDDSNYSSSIINTLWRIANQSMDLLKIIGLRMIDPVSISIVDDSRGGIIIDTIGYSRAFFELYEGAIYMHRAVQYLVIKLDLPACSAHTIPVRVKYYTSASNKTLINVIKEIDSESIYHHGDVQVVCNVYGFVKHNIGNGAVFEKVSQ